MTVGLFGEDAWLLLDEGLDYLLLSYRALLFFFSMIPGFCDYCGVSDAASRPRICRRWDGAVKRQQGVRGVDLLNAEATLEEE